MKVFDIDSLSRDPKQDNLYNFFRPTFKSLPNEINPSYTVGEEKMMRIDLVSNSIYGSTDYMDFIMNLNEIDNPLNILPGDELKYTDFEKISFYQIQDAEFEVVRDDLVDAEKQTKIDPNRQKYIEQNYTLVPTVNEIPFDPVTIKDSRIIIGDT